MFYATLLSSLLVERHQSESDCKTVKTTKTTVNPTTTTHLWLATQEPEAIVRPIIAKTVIISLPMVSLLCVP